MPCAICKVLGHNITTCPSLVVAQHNVDLMRGELARAERDLASVEQLFSEHKAANAVRRAAVVKKKSGVEGESKSKGGDTEKELFGDGPCVLDSESPVPWEKIDVPGGK